MNVFYLPVFVTVAALIGVFVLGGKAALFVALLLILLEVTLSFDNAVVNARVLMRMDERWQKRFLTWGMLIAVFGTRVILPIVIVSASVGISPFVIATLALSSPETYAHLLEGSRYAIQSFGAAFLLMVSLKYFFDQEKNVHWILRVEQALSRWGKIEAIEIGIALSIVVVFAFMVPLEARATVLLAGAVGLILFIFMEGIASLFSIETKEAAAHGATLFVYLNILDSAFSLDSVVGAFALTTSLPIIVVGLGIGAYFVRALTIYFVRMGTLTSLVYLEHGAHWAIFGLAASMFASLLLEVPEIVTGTIGAIFVFAAYYSSVRFRRVVAT